MTISYLCPNDCEAGWVVVEDGRNECADCGEKMIDADQASLDEVV